jgi:hypothetical protein
MDTLELLATNEEEISDLYKLYAQKLPQYENLWLELSREETDHAAWIRDFARGIEKGTLYINQKRFPTEAFQTYHEYLQGSLAKTSSRGIEPMQAFTSALYIEQALIELKLWEVIDTGSEGFDKVALRLRIATKKHIEIIEEYWAKVKDNKIQ